ncbi:hypothetical protein LPJ61_003236 [Coemansia biformis]|uniref:Cytochrome P450 n=1 Tax=Coemansia biformis TaxID=1286918 RepID=A0A9W7YBK9_9FUNG|nr:hypothetical protein LPJ61_003236 [Coemansia biformis]
MRPLLNKFTNAPVYYHIICGKYHEYTTRLHAKYGQVVRIGPNQVSLANPSELRRILATHEFRKGKNYEQGLMMAPSTFSCMDPNLNKLRRRQLGPAYSLSALKAIEDMVIENGALSLIRAWDKRIEQERMGGGGSAQALVNYFYGFHGVAIDVIGVLGFGKSFNMVRDGHTTIVDAIRKHLVLVIVSARLPMMGWWRWSCPGLHAARNYVISIANDAIAQRRHKRSEEKGKPARADILQKILDAHDPETGEAIHGPSLTVEVLLMLMAGTDTTSNTLSFTLMHLLNHPSMLRRVQQDVRDAFPDTTTPIRYEEAKGRLPYLTAVILESMRLHPAVNGYLPRVAPEGGAMLMGKYGIPAGTIVTVSIGACHRNPAVWDCPPVFNPERFMGPQASTRAKDVLVFSAGVRVCLGRNLAWIELYTTLANVLRRYNFETPAGAPYGPHRRADSGENAGQPEPIPGTSFVTYGPTSPLANCQVRITRAH